MVFDVALNKIVSESNIINHTDRWLLSWKTSHADRWGRRARVHACVCACMRVCVQLQERKEYRRIWKPSSLFT